MVVVLISFSLRRPGLLGFDCSSSLVDDLCWTHNF